MPIKDSEIQSSIDDYCIALFEQSPVSIQIMSPEGRIIQVNEAWEELWGMTLDQLEGYNILRDKQLEKNGMMPYIKSAFDGQFTEIPPTFYDPNENIPNATRHAEPKRWTKAVIYPVKNSAGQLREVVLMFEDITARKQAEEKIKANESRYQSFLENTSDIIYSHDLEGNCLSINNAGAKITGYSLEELKKMNIAQLIAPEHLGLAKQMIQRKSQDNTPTIYELDLVTKDGRRLTLEINSRISSIKGQPLVVEGIARNVTGRKLTEQALRVSEARYRSLLENANDIIYSHDLLGNYVAVNGAAEKITGYSLEELSKMNIAEFIVPEHHERIKQVIERKLHDPTPSVHEFDIITKDGHRRTLEVNPKISAIEGEPLAIEGVARDITERKWAEEKLRESEERFRRAFAIETVGIIFLKTDGQITDSNDAFLRMSGYDREDCQRGLLRWDKMTPAEFKPQSLKAVDEFLTLGRTTPYEKQYICKDGSRWWALIAATRINVEEGVEFIIDITERKRTEECLHESEERLLLATKAAGMYSWEIDLPTQEVKYSDNAGAAFNSYLLPKNFQEVMEIINPDDRQQLLRKVEDAVSGTGTFTHQYRALTSAKEINWYESHAVTVRDAQDNPVRLIGITQNISERKHIEELRQSWAERLDAAREDERRHLSLLLHDDVVQQLTVASIKLQRLEKRLVKLLPEENAVFSDLVMTQELLRRNQRSLRQMAHVLHSGVLEQFGLVEAFRKFTKDIATLLTEQSIVLSLNLSPDFPRLEPTVENGIYRMAQEAVVNAVKHAHAESISLSLDIRDNLAVVVIRDDGCGFDLKKIESNGIGFASMYERAEIIGAKLSVTSENGKGTTITLKIHLKQCKRKASSSSRGCYELLR